MTESANAQRAIRGRTQLLLLMLILILAALLRFIHIGSYEANFDELWHLELSTGRGSAHIALPMNVLIESAPAVTSLRDAPGWSAIPGSLDSVTHPPAYPLLLRAWRSIFGESIPVARAFTAAVALLGIVAAFFAVREFSSPAIALWTCLILAVAPTQIDAAQQVRNYMLAGLFSLCAAAILAVVEKRGINRWRTVLLGCCVYAAMMTHYFVAPAAAAMGIYALWRLRGKARRDVVIAMFLAGICFIATWGPALARQGRAFTEAAGPGALSDDSQTPRLSTLRRLAATPLRLLMEPREEHVFIPMLSGALFLLPWLLLRSRPHLLFWILWLTCVCAFATVIDLIRTTRHLEQIRHVILAAPAVCALIPGMLSGLRPMIANGVPAIVALSCLMGVGITYSRWDKELSRFAVHLQADPSEPIVFYTEPEAAWWGHVLYLAAAHYTDTFPRPVLRLDRPADAEQLRQLQRWETVLLVSSGTSRDGRQIIPGTTTAWYRNEPFTASVARLRWNEPAPAASTASSTLGAGSP